VPEKEQKLLDLLQQCLAFSFILFFTMLNGDEAQRRRGLIATTVCRRWLEHLEEPIHLSSVVIQKVTPEIVIYNLEK
jgi:hypothetical protein